MDDKREAEQRLLGEEGEGRMLSDRRSRTSPQWLLLCCAAMLAGSVCFFAAALLIQLRPSNAKCTNQLSTFTPMLEAVEYVDMDFPNGFTLPSPYRGPPTPERNKLWDELWHFGSYDFPKEDLPALGRPEGKTWRTTPEGGLKALPEVFHQLHCLDRIRKYTWLEHPVQPDNLTGTGHMDRIHVDHCIETLRLALMCMGDTTPMLTEVLPDGRTDIDFHTRHKCRNYGKLQEWIVAHDDGSDQSGGLHDTHVSRLPVNLFETSEVVA